MNHLRASSPATYNDELVTVRAAEPARTFAIPPPPPGFVPRPSKNWRTTGPFVGDREWIGDSGRKSSRLPDLDTLCDLCVDGRPHRHL